MSEISITVLDVVLLVLLGWLLGLLGPLFIDKVRIQQRNAEIRRAVLAELIEVRNRLATTIYLIETRLGTFDRELLGWILPILVSYRGANRAPHVVDTIRQLLAARDTELAALERQLQAAAAGAFDIRKYSVRFLHSRLGDLVGFTEKAQALLADMRARIDLYNDEVDEAHHVFERTLETGATAENHAQAAESLIAGCAKLRNQARQIIDLINQIIALG
jgi:hypothetical protein